MATEKPRFSISVDDDMRTFIIDYQHRHKMATQTKAVIALIEKGIDSIRKNEIDSIFSDVKNASSLTNEAILIARDYSDLDSPGKRAVRVCLDDQAKRVKEDSNRDTKVELFPVKEYIQSASAGYGDFSDDDSFNIVDLVKRPPAGTTYIVRVDGNSMEPTYRDGDRVFVSTQETLRYGDIGVFFVDGDLFIKEYGQAGLVSHNIQYPIIFPTSYDTARILGRVLGVCTPEYFSDNE